MGSSGPVYPALVNIRAISSTISALKTPIVTFSEHSKPQPRSPNPDTLYVEMQCFLTNKANFPIIPLQKKKFLYNTNTNITRSRWHRSRDSRALPKQYSGLPDDAIPLDRRGQLNLQYLLGSSCITHQDRVGLRIDLALQMFLVDGFRLVLPDLPNGCDAGDIPAIGDAVVHDILHLLDKQLVAIQLKALGFFMPEINIVLGIRNHCQGK